MTTTINRRINKKEEIGLRAIQILKKHLTETNGIQKIKEIVCNANNNPVEKSNKIFHIIFSPESINALIQNMKLTGTAKSGIGIFKASKNVSSFFSRKTKTTMRRKTTTSRLRSNDPIVSQVDLYLKPESLPIIERALESLMKSCDNTNTYTANYNNVVLSQCIEPVIQHIVTSSNNIENYFDGGGKFLKRTLRRRSHTRARY